MDRNSVIGIVLIAGIFIIWGVLNRPSAEEMERQKERNDSIARAYEQDMAQQERALQDTANFTTSDTKTSGKTTEDTLKTEIVTIENDLIKLFLDERGGRPVSVQLKKYQTHDGKPLYLFHKDSSRFEFDFFLKNSNFSTGKLYFASQTTSNSLLASETSQTAVLRYTHDDNSFIEYRYTIEPGSYAVHMDVVFEGMHDLQTQRTNIVDLDWMIYSPQQEKGRDNEQQYTTMYYRMSDGEVDFFNARSKKDHPPEVIRLPLEWVAFKDQFFSSVLMAGDEFADATLTSELLPEGSDYLKKFTAAIGVESESGFANATVPLTFYFGPNKYKLLKNKYGDRQLQELVTVGRSIIKWINQIVIINLFDFLNRYFSNYGIIILILTVIIKVALLPLTFKSYMSTAKMRVLKPEIDKINEKIPKEKAMERQQATMNLYRRVGVSPLGGCLPMLLQMPILLAMFRFFPTSIELRQESFLWAHDLSTYDAILEWNSFMPFIDNSFGTHLSLFTLLMTVSTILSMKFNNQTSMSNQQMPGMQTMMYIMPVMFMFILNKFSAGLTYYYFLANVITIGQNLLFKSFIDEDELLEKLNQRKSKPAKKSRWQQRLEEMSKQQQGRKPAKKR